MKQFILIIFLVTGLAGCEDVNLPMAIEAGRDALTALTLSDEEIQKLSMAAAENTDAAHRIAPENSEYALRMKKIASDHPNADGYTFDIKVYLDPTINAFAMGNGVIRVYSGLMDMMNDDELRFVLGHEMGHIVKEHVREKMQMAYAGSALRKGLAAQNNIVGDLAASHLGGFVEKLLNAQFSQKEEREADDYGIAFLEKNGYEAVAAVSSLRKLATLGAGHSFLSSHPAPDVRADRLEGKPEVMEQEQNTWEQIFHHLSLMVSKIMAIIHHFMSLL